MTKPGDLPTKKTIHELSKEFPEKTYRQLEMYRDADRQEEAQRIITQQENEELKDDQHKEDWKTYGELEAKIKELQNNLERVKKENNDLYNRIARLKEAELAAHTLQKTRESGL
jgi:septation ring formation regulator EzrA